MICRLEYGRNRRQLDLPALRDLRSRALLSEDGSECKQFAEQANGEETQLTHNLRTYILCVNCLSRIGQGDACRRVRNAAISDFEVDKLLEFQCAVIALRAHGSFKYRQGSDSSGKS